MVVAGIALAAGGVPLIIATHWDHFGERACFARDIEHSDALGPRREVTRDPNATHG